MDKWVKAGFRHTWVLGKVPRGVEERPGTPLFDSSSFDEVTECPGRCHIGIFSSVPCGVECSTGFDKANVENHLLLLPINLPIQYFSLQTSTNQLRRTAL